MGARKANDDQINPGDSRAQLPIMSDKEILYAQMFVFVLGACGTNELTDQSSPPLVCSLSLEETK